MRTTFALLLLVACGGEETAEAPPAAPEQPAAPAADDDEAPDPQRAIAKALAVAAAANQGSAEATEGTFTAKVDGVETSFPFLPADENMMMPATGMMGTTTATGRSAAGERHGIRIMFTGCDVRGATYPATFEQRMPDPQSGSMMPQLPSIEYTNPEGKVFNSTPTRTEIACASLEGERLTCTFGETLVRDQGTGETATLSEGRFSVVLRPMDQQFGRP